VVLGPWRFDENKHDVVGGRRRLEMGKSGKEYVNKEFGILILPPYLGETAVITQRKP
jgi:hypothetical protein